MQVQLKLNQQYLQWQVMKVQPLPLQKNLRQHQWAG
jgi:hypothetical protein